jgi:hypothetical protein
MLITRPNYEDTTRYLYFWSQILIKKAYKVHEEVIDLAEKNANAKKFKSQIQKKNPRLVVLNGHGDYDLVTGHDGEILVAIGINEDLLTNRIVFSRSCRSAKKLGKACVAQGTTAYIGYTEDFVFFVTKSIENPLDDTVAQLFLEPSNLIVVGLLDGKSASDANEKSKDMTHETIQKLASSEATKEDRELIPYLQWNRTHQVCLEDAKAKV